jgi:hypothetical protein
MGCKPRWLLDLLTGLGADMQLDRADPMVTICSCALTRQWWVAGSQECFTGLGEPDNSFFPQRSERFRREDLEWCLSYSDITAG